MHPEILQALKNAAAKRFWGMVQVDFQDGKPTVLRVSETLKLSDKEKNQSNESYRSTRL